MNSIEIKDYKNKMKPLIRGLFYSIYPDDTMIADRMCYDKDMVNHVTTKVAFDGETIIGKANIFLKSELNGNANLGFHVHPEKRLRGVATALTKKAITAAKTKGINEIYIRTHEDNNAAIAVAKSLGFVRDNSRFTVKGIIAFRKTL